MRHFFPKYVFVVLLLLFFAAVRPSWAIEGTAYQIKGAMMMNFIKFIEWPAPAGEPSETMNTLTIGIVGARGFDSILNKIHGRQIGEKKLIIRRIHFLNQLSGCQVLYIGASDSYRSYDILKQVAGNPVLTIGEDEDFIRLGGIIRLYNEKDHIRFEINQSAADHAGLKLSAKLLEVAAGVH